MLLVPFQTPQGPSLFHVAVRTAMREEEDLRSKAWGAWDDDEWGGLRGVWMLG